MRAAKVAAEVHGAAARQLLNGQAGSVAGYKLARGAHLLQAFIKIALCFQVFNDHLNHPIHLREARKIILQVANCEQRSCGGCKKGCGPRGLDGGEPVVDEPVAHSRC
ncbi:probable 3-hydroxyacyl-CoA dehydrogenase [Anaerolineaceae bacterium]|nr:probable 3-hydroxyacyl-CoA dehydrogenase [Anaerolineaceae bacterium]